MNSLRHSLWGLILVLLTFQTALGQDGAGEGARAAVVRSVDALLATVEQNRGLYESDRETYLDAVGQVLEDFVDFREAARGVMARYSTGPRGATPEQLDRFAAAFKDSLIAFYGSALASYGGQGYAIIENPGDRQEADAATVRMRATGEGGEDYELLYAMYRNADGVWKLRNLSVEGVDLRRQYHARFDDLMMRHDYDIDAVIANWPAAAAGVLPEENF